MPVEQDGPKRAKKRESLFGDLTFSQVAAGALAAVTSMFLASSVGIAGSLIGAAVGSVVATVSSQMYRRFLNASAEKLHVTASRQDESADSSEDAQAGFEGGSASGGASGETEGVVVPASATAVLPAVGRIPVSNTPRLGDFSANASAAVIDARAQRLRKARLQRRVVACSAVSALIAVGITAVVIGFATSGEGLGAKPVSDGSGITWVRPSSNGTGSSGQDASGDSSQPSQDDLSQDGGGASDVGSGQGGDSQSGNTSGDQPQSGQDGDGTGGDGSDGSDGSGSSGGSDGGGSGGNSQGGSSEGGSQDGSQNGSNGGQQGSSDSASRQNPRINE